MKAMSDIKLKRHPGTGKVISEEWRYIDGYDGWYEVSNYGRVRSWKNAQYGRRNEPVLLSKVNTSEYLYAKLTKNKITKNVSIHRMVAMAFIDNPHNKPQVNHKDGIKSNNFFLNLEWATYQENMSHGYKVGLIDNSGENNGSSKITERDVISIRDKYKNDDATYGDLAKIFGVTKSNICLIVNKKSWVHI